MTAHRVPPDHASHDLLLVAAHVAGDTSPEEASRASALLAVCPDCRQVAGDLAAIAVASRGLPPPQRTRDFRLTPELATRIRNRSIWDRLAGALLAPRGAARAVPAGLMTLGLAALLFSAMPGFPSAAAPASRDSGEQVMLSPSGGPTNYDSRTGGEPAPGAPEVGKAAPGASGAPNLAPPVTSDAAASPLAGRGATQVPAAQAGGAPGPEATGGTASPAPAAPTEAAADRAPVQGPPLLLILSMVLFGSGILLLVARRVAPRPNA